MEWKLQVDDLVIAKVFPLPTPPIHALMPIGKSARPPPARPSMPHLQRKVADANREEVSFRSRFTRFTTTSTTRTRTTRTELPLPLAFSFW